MLRSAGVLVVLGAWLSACGSSSDAAPSDVAAGVAGAGSSAGPASPPAASAGAGGSGAVVASDSEPAVNEAPPLDAPIAGASGEVSSAVAVDAGISGGAGGAGGAAPVDPASLGPITIWIAGDSTVANGQTPCPRGWGRAFAPHFDDRVTVSNAAAGGRSVHTWLYNVLTTMDASGECELQRDASGAPTLQPRWQTMLDGMRPGDYLLIQFGINDGDRTCDRHVGIEAFKAAYAMMAAAARDRGANPVFLTPVSMVRCTGSSAVGSRGEFVPATLEVGAELGVPVIDLHARSIELFQSLGFCPIPGGDVSAETTGPVGDFFCDDHTHFSEAGSVVIADVVARAIAEQGIPLSAYLR
jgi:lysophospholipase L1-like esterase